MMRKPVSDLVIEIDLSGDALEIRSFQGALLLLVSQRSVIAGTRAAAAYRDICILCDACAQHMVEPVCICGAQVIRIIENIGSASIGREACFDAFIIQVLRSFFRDHFVLLCIQQILFDSFGEACIIIGFQDGLLVLFSFFGGDDHHAVGSAGTIDSRSRSVFQDINTFNVVDV